MPSFLFNVQKTYKVEAASEEAALDLMSSDVDYNNHPDITQGDSDVLYVGPA
jgi:hypothetical protein